MQLCAQHPKNIFILSSAGKPVYSLNGDEQTLSAFTGLIQAIISICDDRDDPIESIRCGTHVFVFYLKSPLYLLAVSGFDEPIEHLRKELTFLHNQILFILTSKGLEVLEANPSYDLRDLLGGTDNVMQGIIKASTSTPQIFTNSFTCLCLPSERRKEIGQILMKNQVQGQLYSILAAGSHLISYVQPANPVHHLKTPDLLLLLNFVNTLPTLRNSESWIPLCLPHFNSRGFLYAYIVYIAKGICLLLITPKQSPDQIHLCQIAKEKIVLQLNAFSAINSIEHAIEQKLVVENLNVPELLYFIYKVIPVSQYVSPDFSAPYLDEESQDLLLRRFRKHCLNNGRSEEKNRLSYELSGTDMLVAISGTDFDLYVALDPLVSIEAAMACCTRLLRVLKKEEDSLFLFHPPSWKT